MANFEITSSEARKRFYQILKNVSDRGDNYTIKVYKEAKVRVIKEDLAQILQDLIGKNVWYEIHKILGRHPQLQPRSKKMIEKLIKGQF